MKPSIRWTLLAVVVVLTAGAASMIGMRVSGQLALRAAVERFQQEVGPTQIAAYAPESVADEENAVVWLQAGADALDLDAEQWSLLTSLARRPGVEWTEEDAAAFDSILETNRTARALLGRAAPLEGCSYGLDYLAGFQMKTPDFLRILQSGRLLAAEAARSVFAGDARAALAALHLQERLSACLRHELVIISQQVGQAAEWSYLRGLRDLIPLADEEILAAVSADLIHFEATAEPIWRSFAAEGASVYEAVQRPGFDSDETEPMERSVGWLFESRVLAAVLEAYADLVARAKGHSSGIEPAKAPITGPQLPWDLVVGMLVPNLQQAIGRHHATRSAEKLASIALTVRRVGLASGQYPERLPDEVADWRSPFSGEAVEIHRGSDGSVALVLPQAAIRWQQEHPSANAGSPPFRWQLPALSRSEG